MPPAYVKPYVRRQKNDAADAAGICEAVTRPSMRFAGVRTLENQAVHGAGKAVGREPFRERVRFENHLFWIGRQDRGDERTPRNEQVPANLPHSIVLSGA